MLLDACQGSDGEEICLWAPQEIMAQARSLKGNIRLVYGRNMWQENVNAFSYDTYSDDQKIIYIWMVAVGNYGDLDMPDARDVILYGAYPDTGDMIDGRQCIHTALGLGVNRIILPGGIKEATLHQIEEITQATAEQIGNYYLLRL